MGQGRVEKNRTGELWTAPLLEQTADIEADVCTAVVCKYTADSN